MDTSQGARARAPPSNCLSRSEQDAQPRPIVSICVLRVAAHMAQVVPPHRIFYPATLPHRGSATSVILPFNFFLTPLFSFSAAQHAHRAWRCLRYRPRVCRYVDVPRHVFRISQTMLKALKGTFLDNANGVRVMPQSANQGAYGAMCYPNSGSCALSNPTTVAACEKWGLANGLNVIGLQHNGECYGCELMFVHRKPRSTDVARPSCASCNYKAQGAASSNCTNPLGCNSANNIYITTAYLLTPPPPSPPPSAWTYQGALVACEPRGVSIAFDLHKGNFADGTNGLRVMPQSANQPAYGAYCYNALNAINLTCALPNPTTVAACEAWGLANGLNIIGLQYGGECYGCLNCAYGGQGLPGTTCTNPLGCIGVNQVYITTSSLLTPPPPPSPLPSSCKSVVDWPNFGFDAFYSNENPCETAITPNTVAGLGVKWSATVQGSVLAEPLVLGAYLSGGHDAVIVATTFGYVYMFDSTSSGTAPPPVWTTFLGNLNPQSTPSLACYDMPGSVWGVTGTPVIDRAAGVVYVINLATIYCLNLSNGTYCAKWEASVSLGDVGRTSADNAALYATYGGLTLRNDVLYATMASHCDFNTYYGHVAAVSASTGLAVSSWYPVPLNQANYYGAGIWGTGAGLLTCAALPNAAFLATGNGIVPGNYGTNEAQFSANHVVKLLVSSSGALQTSASFTSFKAGDNSGECVPPLSPGCAPLFSQLTRVSRRVQLLSATTMVHRQPFSRPTMCAPKRSSLHTRNSVNFGCWMHPR